MTTQDDEDFLWLQSKLAQEPTHNEIAPAGVVARIHNDYNQFNNHPSILQTTALKIEEGLMPYRYVLRDLKAGVEPFVVHRENLKLVNGVWEHSEFYWGHYFRALTEAEKFFRERKMK